MSSSVMSWYIYTLLSFTFISRPFQTAPIVKRKFLFRLADFDGRLVQNWTDIRTSSSVWECAGICAADSNCMSVCFKPRSQECVIYERMVSSTDKFTLFPFATVFALCPRGYSVMGRRCIKVVTEKMDRDSARAHCRDDGADLINLGSQARIDEFRYFMEANGLCPFNYIIVGGVCLRKSSSQKTYDEANVSCSDDGGELVQVKTGYLMNEIVQFMAMEDIRNWAGATDTAEEGTWSWNDGTPVSGWCQGEPNDNNGEDCLTLQFHDGVACLNDYGCTEAHIYICQVPSII
ncbi:asialoglycoprotein receptor 2-like isoform X1 [Haliotis rufescens]|uniref:asialoglycoprotein receptor 2-like isoform X1 n=1 Tax=Haliotis rufescens TaxID=6454 RepID=UPI00201ECFD7|nr:asialoglycoprotein receptor 2-like isoform X1 [Haliotis rufescens]